LAPLAVHVVLQVAGQRRHQIHPLPGEEVRQVLLTRLGQDGQVAAVDDLRAQAPGSLHQGAEARV